MQKFILTEHINRKKKTLHMKETSVSEARRAEIHVQEKNTFSREKKKVSEVSYAKMISPSSQV